VESACAVLEISPSAYYAAKRREENAPARDARDEELNAEITRVWKGKSRGVYGAQKVWREPQREGIEVARCTVERLMRARHCRGGGQAEVQSSRSTASAAYRSGAKRARAKAAPRFPISPRRAG
jgi:hypothetical protein